MQRKTSDVNKKKVKKNEIKRTQNEQNYTFKKE